MRTLHSLALFLSLGAAVGCADDPTQSVSGVFPSSGFIGRKVRVEISGDNVAWKDGVSLDFGADITVGPITVASPTSLFAEIEVAPTATLGPRDVIVRNGSDSLTLAQSFELASPIAVEFKGSLAQGSVVNFTVHNLDFFSPFDDTCTVPSLFGCQEYGNLSMTVPAGVMGFVGFVSPYTLEGTMYIDLDAQPGLVEFVSGPANNVEKQIISAIGEETAIAARTAVALTDGSPTTTTVMGAYDTHLYELSVSGPTLSQISVSPGDPGAASAVYVLGSSGKFSEYLGGGEAVNALSTSGDKIYLIYTDSSGASGYSYAIRGRNKNLAMFPEADASGANDTPANAQNATGQSVLFDNATLSDADDVDWIKLTVTNADAAKKVHVMTAGQDPYTDTVVEVYKNADGAANLLGKSSDSGYLDSVVSSAIGSGVTTILVKVYGSPDYFDVAHNKYRAAIWLE